MAKNLTFLGLLALCGGCSLLMRYSGAAIGAAAGSVAGPPGAAAGGAAGAIAGDAAYAEYFADGGLPEDDDELTWGEFKGIYEGLDKANKNKEKFGIGIAIAFLIWFFRTEAKHRSLKNGTR